MSHETITFDSDLALTVLGVPGRLTHRTVQPGEKPGCWTRQRWISEARPIDGYGTGATIRAELRFDDACRNGHNTFAITGDVRGPKNLDIAGGCLHEDLARVFPSLAALERWHRTSTDGPMHYAANTVYLAGDRDHWGLTKGQPHRFEHFAAFGNSPIWHPLKNGFAAFLRSRLAQDQDGGWYVGAEGGAFTVAAFAHEREPQTYGTHYTLTGFGSSWVDCPFRSQDHAWQWALALNTTRVQFDERAVSFGEGKARDFDAARRCACWPEATDAELSAPADVLRAALAARLPGLLAEFRAAMESIGFLWSPADYAAAVRS